MAARPLRVLEIVRKNEKLRCYVAAGRDAERRVKAKLTRAGKLVQERVFELDERLPAADLLGVVEKALEGIAAATGGRLRVLHVPARMILLSSDQRVAGARPASRTDGRLE
ncbi:MAG: hypothetical protein ACREQ9_02885 [Candidatus Binatia bacterium]